MSDFLQSPNYELPCGDVVCLRVDKAEVDAQQRRYGIEPTPRDEAQVMVNSLAEYMFGIQQGGQRTDKPLTLDPDAEPPK